ncbi:MAG: MFS transporter [Promethearchaeota archaeon]
MVNFNSFKVQSFKGRSNLILILGLFRTFSGLLIGTGMQIFILSYFGSNFYSGLSASAIAITYMFSPVVLGRISDKIGRRFSLLIATAGNAGLSILFFSLNFLVKMPKNYWLIGLIILLRALEGIFNGFFWPILQASITDATIFYSTGEPSQEFQLKKSGVGKFNLGWNAGVLAGSISLFFMLYLERLDLVLTVPIFLQFTNFFCIVIAYHNLSSANKPRYPDNKTKVQKLPDNGTNNQDKSNKFSILLALILIFGYGAYLGLIATTTTNFYKFLGIPMLIGIQDAVRISIQGFSRSKLKFKYTHLFLKLLGILFSMISISLVMAFTLVNFNFPLFLMLYGLIGLIMGLLYSESIHMIMESKNKKRGFLMGIFEQSIGIGFFTGPLLAGYLTEYHSYQMSYFISGIVALSIVVTAIIIKLIEKLART